MRYIREVLERLNAEMTLGEAEALLSSPEADLAERMEAAGKLRRLRVRIFGAREGLKAAKGKPLPGERWEDDF